MNRHVFPVVLAALGLARASQAQQRPSQDPWSAIERVFGRGGERKQRYFRINLPRSDLHVAIANDTLEDEFELTSYIGFAPIGPGRVMIMGEIVVRDDEVAPVLAEAGVEHISVSAIHNHLIGESPRMMYVHVTGAGAPDSLARALRAVFAKTATPLAASSPEETSSVDWTAIDAVLGHHAEAHGKTVEYVFPRRESLRMHGVSVRSTGLLETASEVVFQRLDGGRMACGGELFILPQEVDGVMHALERAGLHVTALHNHTLDEQPRMYWMHWYGSGDGRRMADGVAAALAQTNSVRAVVLRARPQ